MSNFNGYIDVPIVTDPNVLAQNALTDLTNNITGWVPQEGNLEVLLVEEFATMAAEAATSASTVPSDIFAYYGSLIGITQNEGTYAQIQTTWNLFANAPSGGIQIPAGTQAGFIYQGTVYNYSVVSTFTITGTQAVNVLMQAVGTGSAYNVDGLTGISPLSTYLTLSVSNPFVQSVLISATPYAGSPTQTLTVGTNPETKTAYLNRLATEVALMAPRPITPNDYAQMAQNIVPTYRAFAQDGINPFSNLLTANDSNLTTAITNNYVAIGDGTHTPTLSLTGGALVVTAAAMTTTTLSGAVTTTPASNNQITVAAAVLGSGVSTSTPALVKVSDFTSYSGLTTTSGSITVTGTTTGISAGMFIEGPGIIAGTTVTAVATGSLTLSQAATSSVSSGAFLVGFGNEIIVVTAVSSTTWTLASGTWFKYKHNSGVTLTPLQGVAVPQPITAIANSDWLQLVANVECGTDTTATARPYAVSVVTNFDGTVDVYSSIYPIGDTLYDYTSGPKMVLCQVYGQGGGSIAPQSTSLYYNQIAAGAQSVNNYIVWSDATSTKTHKIFNVSFNMCDLNYTQYANDSAWNPASTLNMVPDSDLNAAYYASSSTATWNLASGLVSIPAVGIQYPGMGSAIGGSGLTATSQIFNLPYFAEQSFTLFAQIDTSFVTAGSVIVSLYDASTGSLLSVASGSPTFTTPTSPKGVYTYVTNFSTSNASGVTSKDVYVVVSFSSTLSVPAVSSVIVSEIGLVYGTYTATQVANTDFDENFTWTPGGYFVQNSFTAPRNVVVCPIDSNGNALELEYLENVSDYLESYREANFQVSAIVPNYVPINVTWNAVADLGYDPALVQSAGNAAIANFLSPANWAGGDSVTPFWDGTKNYIRILDIAGVLSSVPGVATVSSINMQASTTYNAGSMSSSDILLSGIAPLPIANYVSGNVVSNAINSTSSGY